MLGFIHRKNKKQNQKSVGPVWSPWVGTGDFSEKWGGGATLSGPSQPAARHALSTVLTTTRVNGLKAVSQPGLQVTHSAGEVGRAVVPPTRVPQSVLSLP